MDWISILLIAIGLSMDSLAVSVVNGLTEVRLSFVKAAKLAFPMAIVQAGMTIAGWLLAYGINSFVATYDHWVAFFLLLFIGLKMISDGFKKVGETKTNISFSQVVLQAIATSIDALAIGISFAFLSQPVFYPSLIIFFTTLAFSFIGLYSGKFLGKRITKSFSFIGGIVLIFIGIKILIEHLYLN